MCDVTLPPVGPVQLQPLLLVLGVFQLALPPQALLGLGAELSTDTDIFCRCQQSQGVFRVFFALPAAAREPLSVLVAGCFKHGQLGSRLTRTLWGGLGHRRGLRGKRCSMRGLCVSRRSGGSGDLFPLFLIPLGLFFSVAAPGRLQQLTVFVFWHDVVGTQS